MTEPEKERVVTLTSTGALRLRSERAPTGARLFAFLLAPFRWMLVSYRYAFMWDLYRDRFTQHARLHGRRVIHAEDVLAWALTQDATEEFLASFAVDISDLRARAALLARTVHERDPDHARHKKIEPRTADVLDEIATTRANSGFLRGLREVDLLIALRELAGHPVSDLFDEIGLTRYALRYRVSHGTLPSDPQITPARQDQRVQLIFHNDDWTPQRFVLDVLTRIVGVKPGSEVGLMLKVHTEGNAAVREGTAGEINPIAVAVFRTTMQVGHPLRIEVRPIGEADTHEESV